jgi:hypothetical protein
MPVRTAVLDTEDCEAAKQDENFSENVSSSLSDTILAFEEEEPKKK